MPARRDRCRLSLIVDAGGAAEHLAACARRVKAIVVYLLAGRHYVPCVLGEVALDKQTVHALLPDRLPSDTRLVVDSNADAAN